MSLEEVKALLCEHQLVPNKLLGQNFMVDPSVFPKLSDHAELNNADIVLDAGAGFGFLTRFLANKAKRVYAVEKDSRIALVLRERVKDLKNVTVIKGDVLNTEIPRFNKVISIPPYYLSSQLVMWLISKEPHSSVLIVQKEFADRLIAPVGSDDYGWLAVVSNQCSKVELLDLIPRWMFYPEPEVDSIIIQINPLTKNAFSVKDHSAFVRLAKWLFTQRNKKLSNALTPFIRSELNIEKTEAGKISEAIRLKDTRVRELAPKDFGEIADALFK